MPTSTCPASATRSPRCRARTRSRPAFFWEWIRNAQPANNNTNGHFAGGRRQLQLLGNAYADLLTGNLNGYQETNFNRINDIAYNTYEGFVQDSWKVSRRLTLELGLRADALPALGRPDWASVIRSSTIRKYSSSCTPLQYCGFEWHKTQLQSVPLGGFPTRALFWQPRFGVAYDIAGKGKTVLRGGWGRYYYHSGQFTSGLDVSAGVRIVAVSATTSTASRCWRKQLDTLNCRRPGVLSPAAVDSKDDKQPTPTATASRFAAPAVVEFAGSRVRGQPEPAICQITGGAGSNINLVPVGAMLSSKNGGVDPNSLTANNFRPLQGFSDLNLATNKLYANYNALQVTWVATKGRYTINMNYTFGKAMGIVNSTASDLDQFNLANNYGVQPANRTHIFNAAYSIELGNPVAGQDCRRLRERLATLRHHAIAERRQPHGIQHRNANFGMNLNGAKIPGTDVSTSATCRCWGRMTSSSTPC